MIGTTVTLPVARAALARADQKRSNHRRPRNPLTDEFDELVQEIMEEWKIPGLSIAVVDGNETYAKVSRMMEDKQRIKL